MTAVFPADLAVGNTERVVLFLLLDQESWTTLFFTANATSPNENHTTETKNRIETIAYENITITHLLHTIFLESRLTIDVDSSSI